MLTLFNRREVYVTQNMQKQAEVRDTLALAGINYTFKVSGGRRKARREPERNRDGTGGDGTYGKRRMLLYILRT